MRTVQAVQYIRQGEVRVSDQPMDSFSTVLGSCVAACLYDPIRRVGGMNHFLLPGADPRDRANIKYGLHLMEQLINAMLREGAMKSRLHARLYGGANVMPGLQRIGDANASFARQFVREERLLLLEDEMGGNLGRRLHFQPASGTVTVRTVKDLTKLQKPGQRPPPKRPPAPPTGDMELF